MARQREVCGGPVTVQELMQGLLDKNGKTTMRLALTKMRNKTKGQMTYEPMPLNLDGITCQEASMFSHATYIACGAPAEALVWHEKDRRVYPMCKACAWHNLRNRGGRLLAGDRRLTR